MCFGKWKQNIDTTFVYGWSSQDSLTSAMPHGTFWDKGCLVD